MPTNDDAMFDRPNDEIIGDLMRRLISIDAGERVREAIAHDFAAMRDEGLHVDAVRFQWDSDGDDTGCAPLFPSGANIIDFIYYIPENDDEIRIIGDDTNGNYIVIGAGDDDGDPTQLGEFPSMSLAAMFVARCLIPEL